MWKKGKTLGILDHWLRWTLRQKYPNKEFFSGPYFSVFGLNTEIYRVNLPIQSEYRKMQTRINPLFGHFLRRTTPKEDKISTWLERYKIMIILLINLSEKTISMNFFSKNCIKITTARMMIFKLLKPENLVL